MATSLALIEPSLTTGPTDRNARLHHWLKTNPFQNQITKRMLCNFKNEPTPANI